MKKYAAIFSAILTASLFSSIGFANMTVANPGLPATHYYGKVQSVSYSPDTQSVSVVVDATKGDNPYNGHVGLVTIVFDGDDLIFGSSLSSVIGLQSRFIVGGSNLLQTFDISVS